MINDLIKLTINKFRFIKNINVDDILEWQFSINIDNTQSIIHFQQHISVATLRSHSAEIFYINYDDFADVDELIGLILCRVIYG